MGLIILYLLAIGGFIWSMILNSSRWQMIPTPTPPAGDLPVDPDGSEFKPNQSK